METKASIRCNNNAVSEFSLNNLTPLRESRLYYTEQFNRMNKATLPYLKIVEQTLLCLSDVVADMKTKVY